MKNILLSLSVIFTMAACQQKTATSVSEQSQMPLTPGYNNSAFSDTAKVEEAFYEPAKAVSKPRPARQTVKKLSTPI